MLFYSYFLHYVSETHLYRIVSDRYSEDKKRCKNKGEFLVSILCLLRVLGIFSHLKAIPGSAEKKT